MANSFLKIFFMGQNLKHVHMTCSFLELLIFFLVSCSRYLVFRAYLSSWQRNIVCEWIQTSQETNHEIKANIFTYFWYWCWKNRFFNVRLNLFMNNFYKHIFRSSRLQMFFKISALKNFAILRIKKRLQHRCFRVRSSHMMLTYW